MARFPSGAASRVRPRKIARNGKRLRNEELALLLNALNNPARVTILQVLLERDCIFGDLAKQLPLAQSTIARHLAVLKSAGLVVSMPVGKQSCCGVVRKKIGRLKSLVAAL